MSSIEKILSRARIVLCETTHSGNIGACARAMKTMGISKLVLASPKTEIDSQARVLAVGATEILDAAAIAKSLDDALADCAFVFAFTGRRRGFAPPLLPVYDAMRQAAMKAQNGGEIALLFGGEKSGLSNADTGRASILAEIPANPNYRSLNLAQAAQVAVYEFRRAAEDLSDSESAPEIVREMPTADYKRRLFEHAERVMRQAEFSRDGDSHPLALRLRLLLERAEPDVSEVNLLRGFLSAIEKRMTASNESPRQIRR